MTSISTIRAPSSADVSSPPANQKKIELEEAAAVLLPGLRHARSLLTVAINVLSHFAPPSSYPMSEAQAAARIRRLLDEFGHPADARR
jgi:hypothetical protein